MKRMIKIFAAALALAILCCISFTGCGGGNTADVICRRLCEYGFGALEAAGGEKLSYPEEKVTRGTVETLAKGSFDALSVLYVENPGAKKRLRVGISDDEFTRTSVPMTKSEVRAVSVSRLELNEDAVVWDVGAGTGSVSVECALAANRGKVWAIEKNPEGCSLIRRNAALFHADNIEVVEGTAPEALSDLPAPTHAFIGGSDGKLKDILRVLLEKNPEVRIVINTVTLETLEEALSCAKDFGFRIFESVEVSVARSRRLGRYHMMTAQNPVHVFVLQGGAEDE